LRNGINKSGQHTRANVAQNASQPPRVRWFVTAFLGHARPVCYLKGFSLRCLIPAAVQITRSVFVARRLAGFGGKPPRAQRDPAQPSANRCESRRQISSRFASHEGRIEMSSSSSSDSSPVFTRNAAQRAARRAWLVAPDACQAASATPARTTDTTRKSPRRLRSREKNALQSAAQALTPLRHLQRLPRKAFETHGSAPVAARRGLQRPAPCGCRISCVRCATNNILHHSEQPDGRQRQRNRGKRPEQESIRRARPAHARRRGSSAPSL